MGRASTKENKNIYQVTREGLGLTREAASELLEWISADKIEKIDNQGVTPTPDEVLQMAEKYNKPMLCNYYCARECKIGKKYVPQIKMKDLSQIILEMLNSLNGIEKKRDKLIEIAADGIVDDYELADLKEIQDQLEKISITIETLQLWVEQKQKEKETASKQ